MMLIFSVWSSHHNIFLETKVFFGLENIPKIFFQMPTFRILLCARKAVLPILLSFINLATLLGKKDNRRLNLLQMHISSRKGRMHKVSDAIIVWRHWCIWIFLLFFACHHLQFKCKIARSLHSKNLFQMPKGNCLFKCRLLCFCKVT